MICYAAEVTVLHRPHAHNCLLTLILTRQIYSAHNQLQARFDCYRTHSLDIVAIIADFLPRDALVHSAVLTLHVVRLSVRPSVCL